MRSAEDEDLVRRLRVIEDDLSDWESDFIGSVAARVMGGLALTDNQAEKAREILRQHEERSDG